MSSQRSSSNSSSSSEDGSQGRRQRSSSSSSLDSEYNTDREVGGMQSLWYWSNYYKTLTWQNRNKVELWKTYALALEYEKMCLIEQLYKLKYEKGNPRAHAENQGEDHEQEPCEPEKTGEAEEIEETNEMDEMDRMHRVDQMNGMDSTDDGGSSEEEEMELEMSEEMMKFIEESIQHKLEMKKLKEKEVEQFELDVKKLKEARKLREKEMKLLYGERSCMIIGMETAVQLSFDKYCDLKSPPHWPNIPLNL